MSPETKCSLCSRPSFLLFPPLQMSSSGTALHWGGSNFTEMQTKSQGGSAALIALIFRQLLQGSAFIFVLGRSLMCVYNQK